MEQANIFEKLSCLIDNDPNRAISEALKISGDMRLELLKASVLVDAGALIRDYKVIDQGVEIYRHSISRYPENPELIYNLANGLHALAISTEYESVNWYRETENIRLEARKYFYIAANDDRASYDIKSQSLTNLGNLLWSSYRWVEAYDFYTLALIENPRNGVASSGALKMLAFALEHELGDYGLLVSEIEYLAFHANENLDCIYSYSGGYGLKGIVDEIKDIKRVEKESFEIKGDEYEKFVVLNNLTLSPTIHSHAHESKCWDNINIYDVCVEIGSGSSVPEIFAMINILKSDYVLARQLMFNSFSRLFNETGNYNDTLDYACYGVNESALALAQRSALDILDKIAVATLAYLNVGGAKKSSFKDAWFKKGKESNEELKPKILYEIENGNTALLALTEVSKDLSSKAGFLYGKQVSRNSSTHRFTVLHDFGQVPSSQSGCLEHFNYEAFRKDSLHTLKLARSSIVYFVQMVLIREARLADKKEGLTMPLIVPSHESIRGLGE